MRRQPTPRSVLDYHFRDLERLADNIAKNLSGDEKDRLAHFREKIADLRDLAISMSAEAPPPNAQKWYDFVSGSTPERIEGSIRKYLDRELSLLGFDPACGLAGSIIDGLKESIHLHEIAERAASVLEDQSARDYNIHAIHSVIREAVGLDGRVPEEDHSSENAAAVLFEMRMALGCEAPPVYEGVGAREREEPKSFGDTSEIEATLDSLGIHSGGGFRDMGFHVATSHLAEETIERIRLMAGGPVPDDLQGVLHVVIDRIANKSGPQITIESEGPEI